MPPKGVIFILGPFWSLLTCTILVVIGYGIVHQIQVMSFAQTPGTVDSVKVVKTSSDHEQELKIAYHYDVNGHRYESTRLRFGDWSASGPAVSTLADRFAAGSHPVVYYNPKKPAESVLVRGIHGKDLFTLLFMMPFTAVMLWIWHSAWRLFRQPMFSGLRLIDEGKILRLRPSYWQAVGLAVFVLALTSFFCVFIIGSFFGGFEPRLNVAAITWSIVLALSLFAGMARAWRTYRGSDDIALDIVSRTLIFRDKSIAFRDIGKVQMLTRITVHSPAAQEGGSTTTSFEVWLCPSTDDQVGLMKIYEHDTRSCAVQFADWLATQVAAPVEEGPAKDDRDLTIQLPEKWRRRIRRITSKASSAD